MAKVKVIYPFRMKDVQYNPGDELEVNNDKAKDLALQGLVKGKGVDAPAVDKMQKGSKKK